MCFPGCQSDYLYPFQITLVPGKKRGRLLSAQAMEKRIVKEHDIPQDMDDNATAYASIK